MSAYSLNRHGAIMYPTMQRTLVAVAVAGLAFPALACSGEGPHATLVPAFGGHVFDEAVDLADAGDGTFLVAERGGRLQRTSSDGTEVETLLDLRDVVSLAHEEQGLLSVAVDPVFARNRHVWL